MKKNLVVQANTLIEAHYRQTYTVQEQRTVLWIISEIHREDRFLTKKYEHKSIKISAKKYAEMMDISVDNVYRDAKKIADNLGSKRFTINTPTGWINLGWISSMEYKHGEGIIEVLIAPGILPYIIELKEGNHTSFQLENILYLQSSHAIKLYQLLVQRKGLGNREIALDEFRSLLGIENTKTYNSYGKIKEKILEVSKREINQKTDLTISYSEMKKGRKVEAIKFKITQKITQETKADETVSA
jgi:plasmid replication initiation protein